MISCTEAVRRLWEYLEGEVSADDRTNVEAHLAFCRRCCGEVEFARELRGVLAAAADVDARLPADVEDRLVGVLDELEPETTSAARRPTTGPSGDGGGPR